MNVIYSMRCTITRLFVISVLSLTSHIASAVPLQPGLLSDPQFQTCLDETALENGWTLTEEVTSLVCPERNIEFIDGVEIFSNLLELKLAGNKLQSAVPVNQLLQLQVLDLSYNKLDPNLQVPVFSALTQLNLTGNIQLPRFYIEDLVRSLPSLTHLAIGGISMGDLSWLPLPGISGEFNFIELDISNTGSFFELGPVTIYPNLRVFKAAGNQIQHTTSLSVLNQLEVIDLSNNQLIDVSNLTWFNSLSQLNLSGNNLLSGVVVADLIRINPGLTHIGVAGISMGDLFWLPPMGPMGEFNLQELDISNTGMFMDIAPVGQYVNLRVLKAAGNGIRSDLSIGQLQQLEELDLSNNDLVMVTEMSSLRNLTHLNFSGNDGIQLADVPGVVSSNPGLTHLNVSGIPFRDLNWLPLVGPMGEYDFIELDISSTSSVLTDPGLVTQYTNLKVLRASNNQIDNVWWLDQLPNLVELDLSDNKIGDVGSLQSLQYLEKLNLSHNKSVNPLVPQIDLNVINQIIVSNQGLTHVGLAGINIGDIDQLVFFNPTYGPGANKLIELDISETGSYQNLLSFGQAVNLRVLKASGNQSRSVGWMPGQLMQLEVLDLSNNRLTDIYSFQLFYNLTQLNLSGNLLPANEVKNLINTNPGLTHIGVAGIEMGDLSWIQMTGLQNVLQELDISETGNLPDLSYLLQFTNLRVIAASGNRIINSYPMGQMQHLEILDLSNNQLNEITDLEFKYDLKQLNLSGNTKLSPIQVKRVVSNNIGLTHIGVGGIAMGDLNWLPPAGPLGDSDVVELDISSIGGLVDLLPLGQYLNLKVINASGNKLKSAHPLDQMHQLEILDLSNNQLIDIYALQASNQLTQLNLTGNNLLSPVMVQTAISNNPNLTHIGVGGIPMGDPAWLSSALPMPISFKLLELDISNTGSFYDLNGLSNYPELRVLNASGNKLQSIATIVHMVYLEKLDLSDNNLLDVYDLSMMPLTQINLTGNLRLDPNSVRQLIQFNDELTHIGVGGIKLGDLSWLPPSSISGQFTLQELDISGIGEFIDLFPLSQYTNLRVIKASGNKLQALMPTFQLQQLEVLDLSNNNLSDVNELQYLQHLQQLNLSNNKPVDPYMPVIDLYVVNQILMNNFGITHLGIAGVAVADLNQLSIFSNPFTGLPYPIVELDVSDTGISDLIALSGFSSLQVVKASDNNLAGAYGFEQSPNLKVLDLSNNALSEVTAVQMIHELKQLNLSGNTLLPPFDVQLAVQANPGLTHIHVAGISMGNLSWLPAIGLEGEYNLKELDVSSTGAFIDASILAQYPDLNVLKAANNNIESIAFFDQLQQLEVLDLSNNRLFDIEPLKLLHNLRELGLSNNELPDPFASGIDLFSITQVILANPDITHMYIGGVYLGQLQELMLYLSENVVELDVSNSGISDLLPLYSLTNLRVFVAADNLIADIDPLTNMTQLAYIDLKNNDVQSVQSFAYSTALQSLDLLGNNKIQCDELDFVESTLAPGVLIRPAVCILFNAPDVIINSFFPPEVYSTDTITLAASAFDPEDGPLDSLVQWSSSLMGPIGSAATIDVMLIAGDHVITASVTDSHGNTSTATINVIVLPNTVPDVFIYSVINGATFNEGEDVYISAFATDLEDGDVAHNLQWTSSIDGFLGFGPSMISRLSAGNHIVTATVSDWQGAIGTHSVSIIINALPQLTLLTPLDASLHNEGEAILFSATANDAEDGVLDANVIWSSNFVGIFGTGGQLTQALTPGGHIITASITDSFGVTINKSILVEVNAAPVVTIQQPLDGVLIQQGDDISLLARASDVEDFTGTLDTQIIWSSNLDGVLGTGAQLNPILSAGSHIITASITDTNGLTTTQSITVNVNGQPQLTILSPLNGTLYQQGDSVTLTGTASDLEDGILTTTIEWVSSVQGLLGTGGSLTQVLSVGNHIITAEVRDSTGGITTHTVSINVNGLPLLSARTLSGESLFNEGDSVTFVGDATDIEDGVITANINWTSSLDGVIGTGAQLIKVLSVGNHTITASVTDSAGVTVSESIVLSINGLPQLNLLAPLSGGSYQEGDSITFSGSASDAEDGILDANINWNSNLQGNIGSGAQFIALLNPGTHIVTVSVSDSTGMMVEKTLTLTVNGLPHLNLMAPLNATVYPFGSTVSLSASANDLEDGVLDASINWTSNIAGALGTGSNLNVVLGEGIHRITATVTDATGGSSSQLVSVTVNPNELPQLTLLSPVNASVSQQGDSVTLSATASDLEDGVLSASVSWSSSQDGVLGTGTQLTRVLSVGSHVITASVTDSAGATTTQASSVTVNSQPQVTIQSPLSGTLFMLQESVNLTAAANDLEDGIISANVQWSSNLDGLLGSGAVLNTNLTLGTHTLTASVTDSAGGVHLVTTQIVIDQIDLSMLVSGNGRMKYAEINWSGSRTAVDIHQEGINVGSYPATGSTVLRFKDQVFIRVCETGTNYCSEPVTYGYTPLN